LTVIQENRKNYSSILIFKFLDSKLEDMFHCYFTKKHTVSPS